MAIVDEIERIKTNIANAYTALEEKGATLPTERNSENLSAVIIEVPTGGGSDEWKEIFISSIDDTLGSKITEIPDGITYLVNSAFAYRSNMGVTSLPDTITYIGNSAFAGCTNLKLEKIPEGVTFIGNNVFQNCSNITIKELPVGVTSIGTYAFYYCSNITEMTCKGNITTIDANAFNGCQKLEKLVFPNMTTRPTLKNANAFTSTPIANKTGYIYVPDNFVSILQSSTNWSSYRNQIKPISELEG